jgi:hypothetical protein
MGSTFTFLENFMQQMSERSVSFTDIPRLVKSFFLRTRIIIYITYMSITSNGLTEGLRDNLSYCAGRDLSNITLTDVDFTGAILTNTKFIGSRLNGLLFNSIKARGVYFHSAVLRNAEFIEAIMVGANLTFADCTGADFRSADLSRAICTDATFTETKLAGANFTGANLRGAIFTSRDAIAQAIGINEEGIVFLDQVQEQDLWQYQDQQDQQDQQEQDQQEQDQDQQDQGHRLYDYFTRLRGEEEVQLLQMQERDKIAQTAQQYESRRIKTIQESAFEHDHCAFDEPIPPGLEHLISKLELYCRHQMLKSRDGIMIKWFRSKARNMIRGTHTIVMEGSNRDNKYYFDLILNSPLTEKPFLMKGGPAIDYGGVTRDVFNRAGAYITSQMSLDGQNRLYFQEHHTREFGIHVAYVVRSAILQGVSLGTPFSYT